MCNFFKEIENFILNNPYGVKVEETNGEFVACGSVIDSLEAGWFQRPMNFVFDFEFLNGERMEALRQLAGKYNFDLNLNGNSAAFLYNDNTDVKALGFNWDMNEIKIRMKDAAELCVSDNDFLAAAVMNFIQPWFPSVLSNEEVDDLVSETVKERASYDWEEDL